MAPRPPDITIVRLPSTALTTYPRLHDIVALLNLAFTTSWHSIPGYVGEDVQRYDTDEQYVDEMGEHGATWLAFDAEDRLIATAGYKPWDTHWKTTERIKVQRGATEGEVKKEVARQVEQERKEEVEAATERFEVVSVVVDPTLQRGGLASGLCGEIDKELRERAKKDGKKRVTLMVRAGREKAAGFWTRMGYQTVQVTDFPVDVFGSKTGFTILDMQRVLEL